MKLIRYKDFVQLDDSVELPINPGCFLEYFEDSTPPEFEKIFQENYWDLLA
jgi:hypothetical protein